jgi:hypothetical protein
MRRLLWITLIAGVTCSGCYDGSSRRVIGTDDVIPPGEPRDVYSITGDGKVTLYWSAPRDHDLDGFTVFISQDDREYYRVSEVGVLRRHFSIRGEALPDDVPFDFVNGNTYFLGVSAYDFAGNESALTEASTTFDTPRPSGRDLRLFRADGPRSDESGYDFSRSPYGYAMSANSLFVDIVFTYEGGVPIMKTPYPQVVEMQDMGMLDFDAPEVDWFVESGWEAVSEVPLRLGQVVLVKIHEESRPGNLVEPFNVAKFRVVALGSEAAVIDWAYQIAPNNRELKPGQTAPIGSLPKPQEVQ